MRIACNPLAIAKGSFRPRSGAGVLTGGCFKIALSELPPAAGFLQVLLVELRHDLTRVAQTRPHEGSPASQMGNCSDISFATQHNPINEVA
jgi:hypothetical protein